MDSKVMRVSAQETLHQARRLPAPWLALAVIAAAVACSGTEKAASIVVVPPNVTAINLLPDSASLRPGDTLRFSVMVTRSDGSSTVTPATFTGSGGVFGAGGLFTASDTSGLYRVRATVAGVSLSDSSVVFIRPVIDPPTSTAAQLATGPAVFLSTGLGTFVPVRTFRVLAGQSLQARIDSATPGDLILVAAGATFTGPFTLKPKAGGSAPIVIRSDAPDASLPPEGTRMTPAFAALLPKLVAPTSASFVITTAPRAANYRLMFLEVAPVAANDLNTLVRIGSANADQPVLDSVPQNIILDRVFLHGLAANNLVRCVQIHGARIAIIDSWLSEAHANGQDSQAIVGWNGPGPYKIVNNFLEGAGENVMFGGADPLIPGMISSDIELRRNHIYKDTLWKTSAWTVKNHLEFKVGQRALIEGNFFENNWVAAQSGLSILIKSTNQSGGFTTAVSLDIIVRSNRIRNVVSGITMAARPDGVALPARNIWLVNNIFEQVSPGSTGGIMVRFNADLRSIIVQNNTFIFSPSAGNTTIQFDKGTAPPSDSVLIINNVFAKAANYGALGEAGGGEGVPTFAAYGATFAGNVLTTVTAPPYPTTGNNRYPATITLVYPLWLSLDYTMALGTFRGIGTDGGDPGANTDYVTRLTTPVRVP